MKFIKVASLEDLPVIQDLAYAIWPHSYSDILSPGQLKYMLNKIYSLSTLQNQLLNLHHNFIIVFDNSKPIGFASFSENEEKSSAFHLHKIYILPDEQGNGTGKLLLNYVINSVKKMGATTLALNVNRSNKARYFYEKNGFTILQEVDINIGEGYFMNDYIMSINL